MPRLIETASRTGTLVAAVNHLLAEGGPRALSLRAIAGVSRVSSSSILHHLGSVEHLLRVSAHLTGRARLQRMEQRWPCEGVAAHLPGSSDDVVDARVWLARDELDAAVALIDGLTVAMCRPVEPMSPTRAVALLHSQVGGTQVSGARQPQHPAAP